MVELVYILTNLLFYDAPLLHYYVNLRSFILLEFFLEIYIIFFSISLSTSVFSVSFVTVPELFCGKIHETFVLFSAMLLPIKSVVASADF